MLSLIDQTETYSFLCHFSTETFRPRPKHMEDHSLHSFYCPGMLYPELRKREGSCVDKHNTNIISQTSDPPRVECLWEDVCVFKVVSLGEDFEIHRRMFIWYKVIAFSLYFNMWILLCEFISQKSITFKMWFIWNSVINFLYKKVATISENFKFESSLHVSRGIMQSLITFSQESKFRKLNDNLRTVFWFRNQFSWKSVNILNAYLILL